MHAIQFSSKFEGARMDCMHLHEADDDTFIWLESHSDCSTREIIIIIIIIIIIMQRLTRHER